MATMANRYGLYYWLKHAGKATLELMKKGGLKNRVITARDSIPYVQTRFKICIQ